MTKLTLTSVFFALAATTAIAQDADRSDWPSTLVVGTASPGGTYAIYGQGLASILSETLGVTASTQQTQGPAHNIVLVDGNRIDIGMTTMGPAYEAMHGELDMNPGTEYTSLRALFPMYLTPFQGAALQRSGISSVSDLAGKTIGTGPRGGTGGTYWERWLGALKVESSIQNGPIGDQTSQLADGRLDAVTTAAGIPIAAFTELETLAPTVMFGFTLDEIKVIEEMSPFAQSFTIPEGTYSSQTGPIETVAMWNVAFANAEMPESLAYEIVKTVFEKHDDLVATHAAAVETLVANAGANDVLPYHPGAVRYYREQGIELPAGALPEGME
ncbi:MAG: TAXI family TRAP transporter solute-binding subunit [Thiothrix sp.]|nr:TAXI family TRAP transporter solute-binding subunit [Thiothrix sp.]